MSLFSKLAGLVTGKKLSRVDRERRDRDRDLTKERRRNDRR